MFTGLSLTLLLRVEQEVFSKFLELFHCKQTSVPNITDEMNSLE